MFLDWSRKLENLGEANKSKLHKDRPEPGMNPEPPDATIAPSCPDSSEGRASGLFQQPMCPLQTGSAICAKIKKWEPQKSLVTRVYSL